MNDLSTLLSGYWRMPEIAANIVVFLNILGALALGLLVGYERSYRGRAAGMRTYGLVCMASCALTVIAGYSNQWYGGHATLNLIDPTRIIQGVVSGIGFLGAGVIMRDGLNISGLTTAASIWLVSAIGVMVGLGFYAAAIFLSVIAYGFMMWGGRLELVLPSRYAVSVTLHFKKNLCPSDHWLETLLSAQGYSIASGSFAVIVKHEQHEWRFVAVSYGHKKSSTLPDLGRILSAINDIDDFSLSHARN